MPVITVLALAGCSSISGDAQKAAPGTEAARAVPTVVVLDASDSMNTDDAPGPRIAAARNAVTTLAGGLPEDTEFGVVAFGSTVPATEGAAKACTDITTPVPLGKLVKAGLDSTLDGLAARGFTPIGEALRTAAAELPESGEAAIVLVSDGASTCAPDPCETAAAIRADRPEVTISAVGFRTDDPGLKCIADKGGGIFVTAENAEQLAARLQVAQNAEAVSSRLSTTSRDGIEIGQRIDDVRRTHPDFPSRGRKDGDRVVYVYADCTYMFSGDELIEIAPGDPPGSAGTTIDGVTNGTPVKRAIELYGKPVQVSRGVATFAADKAAGTAYRIGFTGLSVEQGTVRTVVLCGCLPGADAGGADDGEGKDPVLGRDEYRIHAVGFGESRPNGISFASTAASTIGDLEWESWGEKEALGTGMSQQNGPGEPKSREWLQASDLGWCEGTWAYRSLKRGSSRNDVGSREAEDICNGDRSAPSQRGPVTLSPASKLTFGGAGGVYVGDDASKIPNTYVDKVVAGFGMYRVGTTFYYFRPESSSTDAWLLADPDGTIMAFHWYETDRGIRIGSSRSDVAAAYRGVPGGTCSTSSGGSADFFKDPDADRFLAAVYDQNDKVAVLVAYPNFTDGVRGFE